MFRRTAASVSADADINPTAAINLIEAQGAQAIIDITFAGSAAHYQSALLEVDPGTRTIAVDELFPAGFIAAAGQPATVSLRLEGGRRRQFQTRVLGRHRAGGTEGYLLQLPPDVGYVQRRASFRLKVPPHWNVTAHFIANGYHDWSARVCDVSGGGLRLALPQWIGLQPGARLRDLQFAWEERCFRCDAEVRNTRVSGGITETEAPGCELGVAFIDLPRDQLRALERSLMSAQRRGLRAARSAA